MHEVAVLRSWDISHCEKVANLPPALMSHDVSMGPNAKILLILFDAPMPAIDRMAMNLSSKFPRDNPSETFFFISNAADWLSFGGNASFQLPSALVEVGATGAALGDTVAGVEPAAGV